MCHVNEEWCKIWRDIYLPFQNGHEESEKFWPKHLSLKNLHFNGLLLNKVYMFELQKYRGVMFDDTENLFKIREKIDWSFQNGMKNLANFRKLKNSHFILESKMAELNHNKNSKQLDQPDALRKLYFTLEIID